jgi:hypothetical protein
MPDSDLNNSGDSELQGSSVTRPQRTERKGRRKILPTPTNAIASQTSLQTQNELVPLPWMEGVTIRLEDVISFAKERQETYYCRLQSSSFLAFVDTAQVLLKFAKTPQAAQHIKSNSSCSIVAIIGEHGAGKTTLAKAAMEFVFQYLPKVHARCTGKDKHPDALFPDPWTVCPTFTQVLSSNAGRKDMYLDINKGFAATGPVVQHHMKGSATATRYAGPEALVLVDDAHDPSPWIFGSNPAVFIGLSDGTRCIKHPERPKLDSPIGSSTVTPSFLHQTPQEQQNAPCQVSVTNTPQASQMTFDVTRPSQGFTLQQQTYTPNVLLPAFGRDQTTTGNTKADSPFQGQPLKTSSSMIVCLGNVPSPKTGDPVHEMKAKFVDAHRKFLVRLAQCKASDDTNMKADEQSQWEAGAASFWKAAAELLATRIAPSLARVNPERRATLAMYKEICRLPASEISRLMEMSSTPPIGAAQTEKRAKDPLRNGLPPTELQKLFNAGMDALELCRGFAQASFADPYDAWVELLGGAIEKRKSTQSQTVTEDTLQRIRPAIVLWLPTPSSSSNGLRDEISALVDKACTSGNVSLTALDALDSDITENHPYPRAVQLSPYHVSALVSNCGEKAVTVGGRDAEVWEWAQNKKRWCGAQKIFHEASSVDEISDTRVDKFIRHLQPSSIPPQSRVQEAAAWIITSRFVTYPQTGTIVSERVSVSDLGGSSNIAEDLACILLQLRAVCTGFTAPCEAEAAKEWKQVVELANDLQDPDLSTISTIFTRAITKFNGLICTVARAFVSVALDPEHLAPHSAMLAQVVPEDVGRVVADILASRFGQRAGAFFPRGGDGAQGSDRIDTTVALNALSHAKGQGSVRGLRGTMRATANVYASSLYADRVAAGVEWISSSLAERIFRISFTPESRDDRAVAACREFVTPTGKEFDNIDTVLKHLIHAVDTPSLHFIRESAKSKQVFAIIQQTAESCDLPAALEHAGIRRNNEDGIQDDDDRTYDTDSPVHSQPVSGGRYHFTQDPEQLSLSPAACLTQRRSRSGDPARTIHVARAKVVNEVDGKLSRIRCHAIWAVLNMTTRAYLGNAGDGSDGAGNCSDDGSSSSSNCIRGRSVENETEVKETGLGSDPLTILVCISKDKLVKVGDSTTGTATYLCHSCLVNKAQTAMAVWFRSRRRWISEVEILASSSTVQTLVARALRDMKLRGGSVITGRCRDRKDIQKYFNNLPSLQTSSRIPNFAAVVFDKSTNTFTVDMARLINSSSIPSTYEIVLPRANIPLSSFLRPAQATLPRTTPRKRGVQKPSKTMQEAAIELARTYFNDLILPGKTLRRAEGDLLGAALVNLCKERSSGMNSIQYLKDIVRVSPVLKKLWVRDLPGTSVLADAMSVDARDKEGKRLGLRELGCSGNSLGVEKRYSCEDGLGQDCGRKEALEPTERIDVDEGDGADDSEYEEIIQEDVRLGGQTRGRKEASAPTGRLDVDEGDVAADSDYEESVQEDVGRRGQTRGRKEAIAQNERTDVGDGDGATNSDYEEIDQEDGAEDGEYDEIVQEGVGKRGRPCGRKEAVAPNERIGAAEGDGVEDSEYEEIVQEDVGKRDRRCGRKEAIASNVRIGAAEENGAEDGEYEEIVQEDVGKRDRSCDRKEAAAPNERTGAGEGDGVEGSLYKGRAQEDARRGQTGGGTGRSTQGLGSSRFIVPPEAGQEKRKSVKTDVLRGLLAQNPELLEQVMSENPELMTQVMARVPSPVPAPSVLGNYHSPERGTSHVGDTQAGSTPVGGRAGGNRRRRDLIGDVGGYKGDTELKRRKL